MSLELPSCLLPQAVPNWVSILDPAFLQARRSELQSHTSVFPASTPNCQGWEMNKLAVFRYFHVSQLQPGPLRRHESFVRMKHVICTKQFAVLPA